MNNLSETMISSEQKFAGKILDVRLDIIRLPDGRVAEREYVRHNGAVAIMAVKNDGSIIMEEQFRYAQGRTFLEIPAGKLDFPDEDHLEAAKRELREETGAVAESMTYLGEYIPSPAILGEKIYMYLAEGLTFGETDLDDDEFINVSSYSLEELVDMVMNGEITDGKTQIAVLKLDRIRKDRQSRK